MAAIANPTVSDYIPTVFPKRIKKSDVRIVKMLNSYFNILRVSCGTIKVNTLHRMCLLKLIKDILNPNGLLYPYMSDEDKKIWGKYLGKCFTELTYDDGGTDETVEENICPDDEDGGDTPIDPDDPTTSEKTLTHITVSGQRLSFNVGDVFEFGGTVTAHYSDGSTKILSSGEYSITGYDTSRVGEPTVTVSYSTAKPVTYTIFVTEKVATPDYWYYGFGDTLPSSTTVKRLSSKVALSSTSATTNKVTGIHFWIALPTSKTLVKVANQNFENDEIDVTIFTDHQIQMTIDDFEYKLYYISTVAPLNNNYKITIR